MTPGRLLAGEVAGLTVSLEYQDTVYRGVYTGEVADGTLQGEGRFSGISENGWKLEYAGGWDGGVPGGRGELSAEHLVIEWEGELRAGYYEGQTRDGVPSRPGGVPGAERGERAGGVTPWRPGGRAGCTARGF